MSNQAARRGSIAIVGPGAVGGYIAFAAASAGLDVTVCARTPFEELAVRVGGERHVVPVRIANSATEVAPVQWIVVAVKAHQTPAAQTWVDALTAGNTRALVIAQNGIEHDERIRTTVPLIPALPYVGGEAIAPGEIQHRVGTSIVVPDTPLARDLRAVLSSEVFDVQCTNDFLTASWWKLMSNAAANPLTTLTEERMKALARDDLGAVALQLLEECADVARAAGAQLPDDAPETTLQMLLGFPPGMGSSMGYDREAGRPLEFDALTGAIVRAGRRHGVATPANELVLALLATLDDHLRNVAMEREATRVTEP